MFSRRQLNWKILIPASAVLVLAFSCVAYAQATNQPVLGTVTGAQSATGAQPSGQTQTQSQPQAATSTGNQANQQPQAAQQTGYVDTPESVKQLVQDSQAAVNANTAKNLGVKFKEHESLSVQGMITLEDADGDLMPPGKAKAVVEEHVPAELCGGCPNPISYDAIVIDKTIYVKLKGLPDLWLQHTMKDEQLVDAVENMDFLQYVTGWKNYGIETQNGARVYHVKLTYDANALFTGLKENVQNLVTPNVANQIDNLRSSILDEDIWINADNLLVSSVVSHIRNDDLMIQGEDAFFFWNWGEKVDISPPANSVPIS